MTAVAFTNAASQILTSGTGSFDFDPMGAQFITAVLCWQDTSIPAPPGIVVGSNAMTLDSSSVTTEAGSQCIMALYSLLLDTPVSGSTSIQIQSSDWVGYSAISIYGFTGAGSLGVVTPQEIGTSSAPVASGTATLAGVTADSMAVYVGSAIFGSAQSEIDTSSSGWVSDPQGYSSGVFGIYPFHSSDTSGGGYSITVQPSTAVAFWLLGIAFEVKAGAAPPPPTPTTDIEITASLFAQLGTVTSVANGTTTFTPGAATMILAALACQGATTTTRPSITINGQLMQPVTHPTATGTDGVGLMGLYVLQLTEPLTGSQNVVVSCAPNWAGATAIALYGFTGGSGFLGEIAIGNIATDTGSWVESGTVNITGLTAGSMIVYVGSSYFSGVPASLAASGNWAVDGIDVVSGTQGIYGFHDAYASGGTDTVTLTASTFYWLQGLVFEVLASGASPPSSSVEIAASAIFDLGNVSQNPVSNSFDCAGGALLVAFVNHGGNTGNGPTLTYGGLPMVMVPSYAQGDTSPDITSFLAVLADPPAGSNQLVVEGPGGFFGDTTVAVVSLGSLSGHVGANFSQITTTNAAYTGPLTVSGGSRMVAFVATMYNAFDFVPSLGWGQIAYTEAEVSTICGIFAGVGGNVSDLMVMADGNAGMTTMLLEFLPQASYPGAITAAGSKSLNVEAPAGTAVNVGLPVPSGQTFHLYWESFFDNPNVALELRKPDDFLLSRIPGYVDVVIMAFGQPQCTYVAITDNIETTTGLNWSGSGQLLLDTIALLKTRNPDVEIWVAVQQSAAAGGVNGEPYNPLGWGGMTSTHVANWAKFAADFGITGFSIDYECFSSNNTSLDYHCQLNAETGKVYCYTDTEMLSVISLMRTGLPSPMKLYLDALHVGAYGQDEYINAPPGGYNDGYNLCVANTAGAAAKLDGIHIETYDASAPYDPRTAVRAYQQYFPDTPLSIGLRVGPPDGGGYKKTAAQLLDYCNTAIMLNMAGAFMYSMLWDVEMIGHNGEGVAPFGNYGASFPDSNIGAAVAAEVFGLGGAAAPSGSGYTGQQKNLRLINRPPAASRGVIKPL